MTLNITLAARWLMLQSSDFRLTRSDTGMPVSDAAQKQVVLHYRKWSGLICYTGVAKWGTHDTAEWLGQVLTHEGGEQTPGEVITKLVAEGNKWLSAVPTPSRRHTFTLIAYVRRTPHVYVISNYQWAGVNTLSR